MGSSFLISRLIGFKMAKQLYMMGRPLTAEEALELGIVDKLVSKDKVLEEAINIVKEIYKDNSPLAVKLNKKLLMETLSLDLERAILKEWEMARVSYQSEDHKEAVDAFFNKRKPVFKGR